MNVLAICGAANKNRNTATMLKSAFDGAMSVSGATGEMIYLYDLNFHGCIGCHSCKLLDEKKLGRCAVKDGLTPVLEKAIDADVLLIGSPIYYSDLTGETRAFLERYLFPGMTYNKERVPLYPKRTKVGWVFTMNAPAEVYQNFFAGLTGLMERFMGPTEFIQANDTLQFTDYSMYDSVMFDSADKKRSREERFPKDLERAYQSGRDIVLHSI